MKKRILVIGGTGIIGSAVAEVLEVKHEVIRASRKGTVHVDLDDANTIHKLFGSIGKLDAIVCTAQSGKLTPWHSDHWEADFSFGLKKLIGQIMMLRRAITNLNDDGSVTLTSGAFKTPSPGSSVGHLVNVGLEGFVRHAAIEMPRGIRLNIVSPGWVRESLIRLGMDPTKGTLASEVARSYVEAIEGSANGQILIP
ncbi:short chain dehydrogenase [Paenibacillus tyrfis]|uniref:Short-chain dehydrogenase n=1 Tax=Paenibacillus tyrfis TaxID=1501230 RepID=A0A081NYW0_9BACL|nr:short chain dehydrogenase [Paenibacillus tyrfis]KEQ23633.1 short-chain dehydrogenase [Paenibacillus tyrfis]